MTAGRDGNNRPTFIPGSTLQWTILMAAILYGGK